MEVLNTLLGAFWRRRLTRAGRKRLPVVEGALPVSGLAAEVEVVRDRWGVPHIYATNEADLYFAQGFVHAQDRLWQMELNRRLGAGRLSELFGKRSLEIDRLARTLGFRRVAEADWALLDDGAREALEAYAAGVNAHLDHPSGRTPVEMSLLRHAPERWQPLDSLAFTRFFIWALSFGWYSELVRARVTEAVGSERAAELEIEYPSENPVTLPHGIEYGRLAEGLPASQPGDPLAPGFAGSNAWVVAARRSASGAPILANDPHLPLRLPSVWYENHLIGGLMNVTGVSLPAVPGVVIGHNERIAWGVTVAFTDCQDLFVERFDPAAPTRYRWNDGWEEANVTEEAIAVRRRSKAHVETVLTTRHGPILPVEDRPDGDRIAISAVSLRPGADFVGLLGLNTARGWDDFTAAMRDLRAAQLNIVYADVDGNIGYRVTGSVPVRANGNGLTPSPGWTGEYEWADEIPFEEMPHALNPVRGYLATANNRPVDDRYPHYLGSAWANGYRANRIEAELERLGTAGVADFQRLQLDFASIPGQSFVKLLDGLRPRNPDAALGLRLLRSWDGQLTAESVGGAVYEVARLTAVRHLLESALGADLAAQVMGVGFRPLLASESEYMGNDTVMLLRLLARPDGDPSRWIEQAGGRSALLVRSLADAVRSIRRQLGNNAARWQWGRLHRARFRHVLGMRKPLDRVFDRGPFPVGGDADTPCQFASAPGGSLEADSSGPSYRQVIDLGGFSRSVAMHAPGQSGQIGSAHYDDLIEPWLEGRYHPMLWTREEIVASAETTLVLTPEHPSS